MKKLWIGGLATVVALGVLSFSLPLDRPAVQKAAEGGIKWYTWEEAIALSEKKPKKIFIDVYTDWCGWCKKMDQTTFADPKVSDFVNKNFYAVKFNAEQRANVVYKGKTLKFIASGSRGVHELAYSLLDGRLGYPSYVYLDEEQRRITISPGYKTVEPFLKELTYISEGHYQTTSYEDYLKSR